jgi:hypothetical protein
MGFKSSTRDHQSNTEPWVRGDPWSQIPIAAEKDQWVDHVTRFQPMPGARQLLLRGNDIVIGSASFVPAIPNGTTCSPAPPGATMPVANPPTVSCSTMSRIVCWIAIA